MTSAIYFQEILVLMIFSNAELFKSHSGGKGLAFTAFTALLETQAKWIMQILHSSTDSKSSCCAFLTFSVRNNNIWSDLLRHGFTPLVLGQTCLARLMNETCSLAFIETHYLHWFSKRVSGVRRSVEELVIHTVPGFHFLYYF